VIRAQGFTGVAAHDVRSYVMKLDKIASARNSQRMRETFPGEFGPPTEPSTRVRGKLEEHPDTEEEADPAPMETETASPEPIYRPML